MSIKQKQETYAKQIRRKDKEQIIERRRESVLQFLKEQNDMREEALQFLTKRAEDMTLLDIINIARFSQTEENICILKKDNFQTKMSKFMHEDYICTDQQFYASFILSNLFCVPTTAPNDQLTYNLMILLEDGDKLTKQNCLSLLYNATIDFVSWKNRVVRENAMAQKLANLFDMEHITKRQISTLVGVVNNTLIKAQPNNSFKSLRRPLCKLILNLPLDDCELLRKAMHCLNYILVMFQEETGAYITQSTIVPRLIDIFFIVDNQAFAYRTLEFIRASLHTMQAIIFDDKVMPLIRELQERNFELGKISLSFCTVKIQQLCYNIIYSALENRKLDSKIFFQSHLAGKMQAVLESTQNQNLMKELLQIFILVQMQNPTIVMKLDKVISNARQYFSENKDIIAATDYIESLRGHESCL